jgi:dipeptidyl aminopeptidase/acylaminoacyl peptidase
VPYYGVYDLTEFESMHELMLPLLEHLVMQARFDENRQLFTDASPIARVHRNAPPFFVLHGENDDVVPHSQARAFTGALRGAGARTVSYAEIPNAHHAFDAIGTLRCQVTAEAVASFLGIVYGRHIAARGRRRRAARTAG